MTYNNKMGETFFVDQQDLSGSQDQKKKIMLRYKIVKLESQNSAPQPMSSSVGQYMHEGKDEGEGDVKTPRFWLRNGLGYCTTLGHVCSVCTYISASYILPSVQWQYRPIN